MSTTITVEASDGHKFDLYKTGNVDAERAIIVLQEIFGITSYIRKMCEQFAALGYTAVAPALFDRKQSNIQLSYDDNGLSEGMKLAQSIARETTLRDVDATVDFLKAAGHKRIGVLGFCWGGSLAWHMATRSSHLHASVAWYGGGIAAESHLKPKCPVQLHFGGQDPYIPHIDITKIRQNQPDLELFVYDDADHGFGCFDRSSYNKDAADLAWQRTTDFFGQYV